jgi:deoxycytidylate deaminase
MFTSNDAELVIGLVSPVGIRHEDITEALENQLAAFGYSVNHVRLSELFEDLYRLVGEPWNPPAAKAALANFKMDAGNLLRERTQRNDILALAAASMIGRLRAVRPGPLRKTAHVVTSLKRPEEVETLRQIYGCGFYLLSLSAPERLRRSYFENRRLNGDEAQALIDKDRSESHEWGQRTQDTFQLADCFVSVQDERQLQRFLNMIFGCPAETPTTAEHAMFTAYAAALRSGDLSRQVGAAILDANGDLLAVGHNEVPKRGGGLYTADDAERARDIERGHDANELAKDKILSALMNALGLSAAEARALVKPTGLLDITEFGRAVHAEMEALLACARTGRSPRGATLYTTTFPCHNCCRHIIAAGIEKVYFVEPYPKSKAGTLHNDAISIDEPVAGKLPFLPFIGVAPRRYFDFFSMTLSSGRSIERKRGGMAAAWSPAEASVRVPMQPDSYLERELEAVRELASWQVT